MAVSLAAGLINGRMEAVTSAILGGADQGVSVIVSLLGSMCLWSGLMAVAEQSGLTQIISRFLSPLISLLFRGLDKKSSAARAICLNITANLLGLGNAATPMGLAAMKELQKENPHKDTASNHMITFVVMNTASLQLIPATTAALRSRHGSPQPFDILPAVWIASLSALTAALIADRLLRFHKREGLSP